MKTYEIPFEAFAGAAISGTLVVPAHSRTQALARLSKIIPRATSTGPVKILTDDDADANADGPDPEYPNQTVPPN